MIEVNFTEDQTVTAKVEQKLENVQTVTVENFTHVKDGENHCIHVYLSGIQFPLKNCLGSNQAAINTAFSNAADMDAFIADVVKQAVEAEDYS